jgi:NhaP-type Na+/H+ and K+/H+ antiporter
MHRPEPSGITMTTAAHTSDPTTDISRPFVALARQLGVGVALGAIAAALLVPGIPSMRDKPDGYTVFLASMLALYGITDLFEGNGAMAVLVASLLIGNASSIVPRLFPAPAD